MSGPKENFEKLFKEFFIPLTYFTKKYISDTDMSKEIVHSVFVRIWENRNEFDFNKPAKSYLFTSVYNRCMNYLRDNKKMKDFDSESSVLEIRTETVPSDQIEAAELEFKIKQAIDSLPEKTREIFCLNRFEEKKYSEIAQAKKISVKTVEAQISKALKLLRELLKDYINLLIFFLWNIWRNT